MDCRSLPGVLPREVVEGALPLERPDPPEVGLLVSICPGCPPEGVPYRPHRLRVKIISPDYVDVFCPHGCEQKMLVATIVDLFKKTRRKVMEVPQRNYVYMLTINI